MDLRTQIIDKGLKATHQRIVIYNTVLKVHNHPTAEQVYELIHGENPSITLATVYKTLDTLVEVGLMTKVKSEQGNYRFDANISKHNHIYCVNTQEIIDYQDEELDILLANYFKNKSIANIKILDIQLQISAEKTV